MNIWIFYENFFQPGINTFYTTVDSGVSPNWLKSDVKYRRVERESSLETNSRSASR